MEIKKSKPLDNPLISLISEWKNKALTELNSVQRYVCLQQKKKAAEESLTDGFNSKKQEIFHDYLEVVSEIQGIEAEKLFVSGITCYFDMEKCFDSSSPEHKKLLDSLFK